MARRLTGYQFKREGKPIYPWSKWTNGEVWEATKGVDYQCESGSFVVYLHKRALDLRTSDDMNDVRVQTKLKRGGDGKPDRVVFQFIKTVKTPIEPDIGTKRLPRKGKKPLLKLPKRAGK